MNTVREIMQTEVVSVDVDTPVVEVMRMFLSHQISGAPVVATDGVVLGVVSATDLIRMAARAGEIGAGDTSLDSTDLPREEYDEDDRASFFLTPGPLFSLPGNAVAQPVGEPFEGLTVREIMTPAAFSIGPDDSVEDAAGFLLRGHIHRALVVEDGTLLGLVTTFDLLRVLAGGAADEEPAG